MGLCDTSGQYWCGFIIENMADDKEVGRFSSYRQQEGQILSGKVTGKSWMSPRSLERLLDVGRPSEDSSAFTLYVPPGHFTVLQSGDEQLSPQVKQRVADVVGLVPEVASWEAGAGLFTAAERQVIVLPPFPLTTYRLSTGWDVAPLVELLQRQYTIGVVLLRLGRFAIGVFRGPQLVASKVDTRYVKGRHRAGGSSQRRFERIRDKQVREMYDKTCAVAQERFASFEGEMEFLSLGGERYTLLGFWERCPYLQHLGLPILPRTLDVRVPNRAALDQVCSTIYESLVVTIE